MKQQYILKRVWQSKTGLQEFLYLGYNNKNKIDCISNKEKAIRMTKEECEEWLLVLSGKRMWSIEEDNTPTPTLKNQQEEKENGEKQ